MQTSRSRINDYATETAMSNTNASGEMVECPKCGVFIPPGEKCPSCNTRL